MPLLIESLLGSDGLWGAIKTCRDFFKFSGESWGLLKLFRVNGLKHMQWKELHIKSPVKISSSRPQNSKVDDVKNSFSSHLQRKQLQLDAYLFYYNERLSPFCLCDLWWGAKEKEKHHVSFKGLACLSWRCASRSTIVVFTSDDSPFGGSSGSPQSREGRQCPGWDRKSVPWAGDSRRAADSAARLSEYSDWQVQIR